MDLETEDKVLKIKRDAKARVIDIEMLKGMQEKQAQQANSRVVCYTQPHNFILHKTASN